MELSRPIADHVADGRIVRNRERQVEIRPAIFRPSCKLPNYRSRSYPAILRGEPEHERPRGIPLLSAEYGNDYTSAGRSDVALRLFEALKHPLNCREFPIDTGRFQLPLPVVVERASSRDFGGVRVR